MASLLMTRVLNEQLMFLRMVEQEKTLLDNLGGRNNVLVQCKKSSILRHYQHCRDPGGFA